MKEKVKIDAYNPSIQRIDARCIDCGVCLSTCTEEVGIDKECRTKDAKSCIYCGRCVLSCPMGALKEKYDYKKVLNLLKDTDKIVTVSYAPAIRVSLKEEFGQNLNVDLEEKLPTLMRELGFTYVFDIAFGADVTIMEEASELLSRISHKSALPMFTSCCPSWVRYASIFHPEILPNLSTIKSPIGIMSTLIKTYYKEMNEIDKDIITIAIAPCTAKKYEATYGDTDFVLTTRELAMMIRECDIDLSILKPSLPDVLLSEHSRAGLSFGMSGGVMSAALYTVHYLLTGKEPEKGTYDIDIEGPITKKSFKIGDEIIDIGIVYGLKNVKEILKEKNNFDFIEVMSCEGGCIGGGGQPITSKKDLNERITKRRDNLASISKKVQFCHQNTELKELYNSFLTSPLSKKAESLLHTKHKTID